MATQQQREDAAARTALHQGQASQRILVEGHDLIGIAGEAAFGDFCGQSYSQLQHRGGDKGVDFRIPFYYTVDVKTSPAAGLLLCEEHKLFADIYVLAKYDKETQLARLLGWTWGWMLKRCDVIEASPKFAIRAHAMPREKLFSMELLRERFTT